MENLKKSLKPLLSSYRFKHSLKTVKIALKLAKAHHLNKEWVQKAALLHDVAKDLSLQEKVQKAQKLGCPFLLEEQENSELMHAPLGAFILEKEWHIKEPEILSAVKKHTTGDALMSPIDLTIFIADFLAGLKIGIKKTLIYRTALKSLEKGALKVCVQKINWVLKKQKPLASKSILCYHDLLKKVKE